MLPFIVIYLSTLLLQFNCNKCLLNTLVQFQELQLRDQCINSKSEANYYASAY